uniref:Major facilitator superfamily (MFS) profile domain-containing protein n=1 Tax=Araucaria cunninghamii TaxID=56994 RepID=A0A0D6QXA6_ARACU
MGSVEREESLEAALLEDGNSSVLTSDEEGKHTGDGSVDVEGRPSVKATTGNWRACPFILGNECCERLAYYGINTNLVTYLTKILHQGNATAAKNVTTWSGTCYITPLLGAVLADAYWGRYWTIAIFSTIYFIGMATLTLSASVSFLKPPSCTGSSCPTASPAQYGVFFLGLYLIALGTGGIKPCVSSFGADQFDDTDPTERKKKGSFFNWFYFSINVGALIASSVLVWVQDNIGWGWGFGIPTVFMGLAIFSFFSGTPLYRLQKPGGSPLARVCQVVVASLRKLKAKLPTDQSLLYEVQDKTSAIQGSRKLEHTEEFKCLDKAATVTDDDVKDGYSNPWQICTVTQVEELKILLRMFPVWATTIVFSAVYAQMSTMFVEQGMTLDTRIGSFEIPPASLSIFDTLSVIVWVPVYDRILIPIIRKYTKKERGFTQLQRIGIGLFISIMAMAAAALVEIKRLEIVKTHHLEHDSVTKVPMTILWQIPQYFLIGAAEVFTFIGQLEFFYDESPDAMRSLCSALSLLTTALGNYLSSLIVTIVAYVTTQGGKQGWIPDNLNEGHLDYYFWVLAFISLLNLVVYLACAHWYKYKKAT